MQRASGRELGILELLGLCDFEHGVVRREPFADGVEVNSCSGFQLFTNCQLPTSKLLFIAPFNFFEIDPPARMNLP